MVQGLFDTFVRDLQRVYRVLPGVLRVRTIFVFVYMGIVALLEVVTVMALSCLAMSVAAPENLKANPIVVRVLDSVSVLKDFSADPRYFVLLVACGVVVLTLIKNSMTAYVAVKSAQLGEDIALFAGERILTHYLYSPYMWHLSGDSGATFQALSWKSQLGTLVTQILTVYTYFLISLGLFLTLISATPLVLFTTLVATGLLAYLLYKSVKNSVDEAGAHAADFSERENRAIMSAMNGIREVILYRQQPTFARKYLEACDGSVSSRVFLSIASPLPSWVLEVVGFAVIPGTVWMLIRFRDAGMSEIAGSIALVMIVAWRILPMLNRSLSSLIAVRSIRMMAIRCIEKIEYSLTHQANPLPEPDPQFGFSQSIGLHNVAFRYPAATEEVIKDFSLTIRKGERLGIIGPSGAGKSTIAGLLTGLMEPTSGHIDVDGAPLVPARLSAYIMRVGYVPQTPYIMPGNVAENVAFSQWGKPYDEKRVWKACRMAALDIVESHEKGILIPIGDHGTGLSGGQTQRVSIARALYAEPDVLILDEATSALDQGTEAAIMNTINALPSSLTTIIIAHRLSTVAQCDHLVWIENGRVIQEGAPDEILPRYLERLNVLELQRRENTEH